MCTGILFIDLFSEIRVASAPVKLEWPVLGYVKDVADEDEGEDASDADETAHIVPAPVVGESMFDRILREEGLRDSGNKIWRDVRYSTFHPHSCRSNRYVPPTWFVTRGSHIPKMQCGVT